MDSYRAFVFESVVGTKVQDRDLAFGSALKSGVMIAYHITRYLRLHPTTYDSRLTIHDSRFTTLDSRLSTPTPTHDSRVSTHDSRLTIHASGFHHKIRPLDGFLAPAAADVVELLEEGDFGFGVVEEIELDIAADETTKLDADEADQRAAFIDLIKQFAGVGHQVAGLGSVGNAALLCKGVEIGIADLDGDAAGEP